MADSRKIKSSIKKVEKPEQPEQPEDKQPVVSVEITSEGEVKTEGNVTEEFVDAVKELQEDLSKADTKRRKWKQIILMTSALIGLTLASNSYIYYYYNYIKKPEVTVQEKEVVVEKEKIQYVERSKTPTADFLTYLNPKVDPKMAKIIAEAIDEASKKYRLPRKLICGIIRNESNINPFAKSHVGAVGLMQVMPKIHQDKYKDKNLWHIGTNIDVGCSIFREYLDKNKGDLDKTFHAYLSKNAAKEKAKKYQDDIQSFWAQLEMYDYMTTIERERENNDAEKDDSNSNDDSTTDTTESEGTGEETK